MYRTSINAKPQDDTLPFESQLGVFRNSKDAQSQTLLSFSAMKSGKNGHSDRWFIQNRDTTF